LLYTLCLWHRGYGDIPFHRGQRPAFAPPEGVTAFQKKWCIRCGKLVAPGAKARQGTARRALLDIGSRRRDRPHGPRFRVYRVAIPRRPFGASAPDQGTWAPPSRKPPGARRRKRHLSFRAIRRVPAPRAPLGFLAGGESTQTSGRMAVAELEVLEKASGESCFSPRKRGRKSWRPYSPFAIRYRQYLTI
jgi:hypothetical protein